MQTKSIQLWWLFIWFLVVFMTRCEVESRTRKALNCLQAPQSGSDCFGYIPSYAYNPHKRKCEHFIYGGCGGNENRFETRTECEQSCRDV